MAPNPSHKRFNLYQTRSTYTFVPAEGGDSSLVINRISGDIQITSKYQSSLNTVDLKRSDILGIVGIITLAITDYIVVLTSRSSAGALLGHDIYRAEKFELLPVNPDVTPELHPAENYLAGILQKHFSDNLFWVSYTWDLTRRLQAQYKDSGDGKYLWEVADERFFWNRSIQSRLIDIAIADPERKIGPFILPILFGTFTIRQTSIKNQPLQMCLISRRSRHRAGTRYFRRGVDREGHVANFNETEQIILFERQTLGSSEKAGLGSRLSFVQIRGSIPLYWAEINNLQYKPELQVMELSDTDDAIRTHLQELVKIYGPQDIVNLINHKGHEGPVKNAFEKHIATVNAPDVRYEYFDFHSECSKMRWNRISLLIDSIEEDLIRNSYFYEDPDLPTSGKLQNGTVRTNCMDNLDRTNVAQSAIAKWMLNRQLRDIGLLQESESVDSFPDFMHHFRNVWADHADDISKAYSGTGALKTDFTRTGERSRRGLIDDGINSIMRYLKNNFFDGPRQDGFDLVTGNWSHRPGPAGAASLWLDDRPLLIRSMPPLASMALFMICAGLTLPRTSDYSLTYWFALWIFLLVVSLLVIISHGIFYVSWPRLNPLTELIEYNGPGFIGKRKGRGFAFSFAGGPKAEGVGSVAGGKGRSRHLPAPSREIELGTLSKKRVD